MTSYLDSDKARTRATSQVNNLDGISSLEARKHVLVVCLTQSMQLIQCCYLELAVCEIFLPMFIVVSQVLCPTVSAHNMFQMSSSQQLASTQVHRLQLQLRECRNTKHSTFHGMWSLAQISFVLAQQAVLVTGSRISCRWHYQSAV